MLHAHATAPGAWLVAVDGDAALAVNTRTLSGRRLSPTEVLAAVRHGGTAALDLLTAHGLSATPAFVWIVAGGSGAARCIVRGDARAEFTTTTGDTVEITADGVATWAERRVEDPQNFVVRLEPDVDTTDAAADALPIASGVIWADAIASSAEALGTSDGGGSEPSQSDSSGDEVSPSPADSAELLPETYPVTEAASLAEETITLGASGPLDDDEGGADGDGDDANGDEADGGDDGDARGDDAPAGDDQPDDGYDHLFGATVVRSIEDAAVRPEEEAEDSGDHDGLTVMSGDLAELRGRSQEHPSSDAQPPSWDAPPAPPRFRLDIAGGRSEPLEGTTLVGRAPSVSKVSGGAVPRLVTVGDSDQDISRNHVRFTLEGGTIVVTDLHSRNGTSVVLPGKAPQRLRQGEPTAVLAGTVVDLGGGVTLTVRQEDVG